MAAQGPLWSPGGDRGFFKSSDGGKSWKKTLGDDEWTGVTDIVVDPRDPNRVYAATWQHHRTVAAYMGGGPKSRIHRSDDGGETWKELSTGLPEGPKGKIGLAISPQQPDVVYAVIELNRRQGGLYRSTDRGNSWKSVPTPSPEAPALTITRNSMRRPTASTASIWPMCASSFPKMAARHSPG